MNLATLNESYIYTPSIGLKAILGLDGLPGNRVILVMGKPHTGKSTFLFNTAADLDRLNMAAEASNSDGKSLPPHKIIIIETENKIDNIYLASFFSHRTQALGADTNSIVLKYHLANHKKLIRQIEALHKKGKLSETFYSPHQLAAEKAKLAMLTVLLQLIQDGKYPYPPGEIILPNSERPTVQQAKKLIRDALADYRLQSIHLYQQIHTLDDLERFIFVKFVEPVRANPRLREQHTFIIVDTITELLPKQEYDAKISTDGSNFLKAKYISKWASKLPQFMLEANLTIGFVAQETTNVKKAMLPYSAKDPVMDPSFNGGDKIRYSATHMIVISRQKEVTMPNGQNVKVAKVSIPKDSLLRGAKADREGNFYIVPNQYGDHRLEFDEPYFQAWTHFAPNTDPNSGVFYNTASNKKNLGVPLRYIQDQIDALPAQQKELILKLVKPLGQQIKLKGTEDADALDEDSESINDFLNSFADPDDDNLLSDTQNEKAPTEPAGWDPATPYLFGPEEQVFPFILHSPYIRQIILDNRSVSTNRY